MSQDLLAPTKPTAKDIIFRCRFQSLSNATWSPYLGQTCRFQSQHDPQNHPKIAPNSLFETILTCMSVHGAILIDFSSIFEPSNSQKTLKNKLFFFFLAFLHFRYHRSWDRFCSELGAILDSKIDPKSVPRGSSKVLKIISVLQCLLEPSKINFLANMAPTWPDFAPQDGSKLGPKSVQNRFRSRLRFGSWFWTEFGPILDRFWTDVGPIFGWF